ncbi:SidA/IucD/PvdA family monooxygenase [Acinetobacter baumannii]|uniref:SidA/IucD/PvdA family monooxygenase n=1 Tax=Acinetobacter baumannii TaxID=470 RepID=UPI00264A4569|nr:SidA/IucD/PvdA family monooxygenase [Acinetobacter baumannii]MCZ2937049.1 lysine N(6)-hydroxylase/L-ornithine N(5)-oxygenase family protein [Acinetobacter baumannii]
MVIYDVIGVGFGPSNLAVAAAINEDYKNIKAIFIEQKEDFVWHQGMLINDTTMQISFLKDIATLRNPSSQYSFLTYLHEENRLENFANLRTFYPTRIEFNNYLTWAAKKLNENVVYSRKVINIYSTNIGSDKIIVVETKNNLTGEIEKRYSRNIIVACGLSPRYTINYQNKNSKNIFHSAFYLQNIENINKEESLKFLVVGGGQSAAEITKDLHSNFKNSTVTNTFSGFGLKPADDSEFVNEVFCTYSVDEFYNTNNSVREQILENHSDTNYAVVDVDLIKELYRINYEEKVLGKKRLIFNKMTKVISIEETNNKVIVQSFDKINSKYQLNEYDVVVLATGYTSNTGVELLKNLKDELVLNQNNNIEIDRYYKVKTKKDLGIYSVTGNELTHGLSDTLLSVLAVRADEILLNIQASLNSSKLENLKISESA